MGLADLHIHTTYSWDGTAGVAEVLRQASFIAKLDVVAITDHDSIEGTLEALDKAPAYGLDVVPGVEVTTAEGHLLALYVRELVPSGRSLIDTLHIIGSMGGLAIAPHPTARWTQSLSEESIRHALDEPAAACILVGVETFNGSLVRGAANAVGQRLARTMPLAPVANSDSHVPWSIGSGCTVFAGGTAADLRTALETRTTTAVRRAPAPPLVYMGSWFARRVRNKLRHLPAFEPRPPASLAPPATTG